MDTSLSREGQGSEVTNKSWDAARNASTQIPVGNHGQVIHV